MDDFERHARETSIRISEEGDVLPLQDDPDLYTEVESDPDDDPEEIEFEQDIEEDLTPYDRLRRKFLNDINSRREKGKPARVNWLGNWVTATRAIELGRKNNRYRDITEWQWQALAEELRGMGLKINATQNLGRRAVKRYEHQHIPVNGGHVADWAERAAGDYEIEDDI